MKLFLTCVSAVAIVTTLQIISYKIGIEDGRTRERYGKTLSEAIKELSGIAAYQKDFLTIANAMVTNMQGATIATDLPTSST